MGNISFRVFELLNRIERYLKCHRQSPDAAKTLMQPLFNYIDTLNHQDLMTCVSSGENLLMHVSLILQRNDALTNHGFIFSALITRSLFFRLHYPHLPDATTFLLTSSESNQTPFQLIESLKNKDMLDSYLKQIQLYISEPFVAYANTLHRCAQDVFDEDVLANKRTPWLCPLAFSFLFLGQFNASGFRLLDNLVQPYIITKQFIAALDVLRGACVGGYISTDIYKNVLLIHLKPKHSLLHELIMAGDVVKFNAYLSAIEKMYQDNIINADEYKSIFFVPNQTGYRAVHQGVNAPNVNIARCFLHFLKNECSLPEGQRVQIIKIRSDNNKAIRPKRIDAYAREINGLIMDFMRLRTPSQRVCEEGFFPISHEVTKLPSVNVNAPPTIATETTPETDRSGGWSPWSSPLLYSPTDFPGSIT